ncbi:MAG: hypothetical protein D6701_11340, partial [Gemmatimonadetes bacterium]
MERRSRDRRVFWWSLSLSALAHLLALLLYGVWMRPWEPRAALLPPSSEGESALTGMRVVNLVEEDDEAPRPSVPVERNDPPPEPPVTRPAPETPGEARE